MKDEERPSRRGEGEEGGARSRPDGQKRER